MGGLIAFLGIIIMIILHEWGHFIVARIFKVPVYEFSIGMGPKLFQRKCKSGTFFSIRALPIGGYCAFDDAKDSSIQDSALNTIPIYQKILICFAGPLMNFITGFLIFLLLSVTLGNPINTNVVASTEKGFPAYEILQENDEILTINGIKVDKTNTISNIVKDSNGEDLTIVFIRDGKKLTEIITPKYDESQKRYFVGITNKIEYEKITGTEIITKPLELTKESIAQVYGGLFQIITGQVKFNELSGMVGIVSYANGYAKTSTIYLFFTILAVISINLGVMNLLPIPGLDGSKIIFGFIEMLRGGKRINEELEGKLTNVSFYILIGLMVIITINDIIKLIF